jgi:hypothetical protein
VQRRDGIQRKKKASTGGALLSAEERGRGDTLSGLTLGRPWAYLVAGPDRIPAAFYSFSDFFSISLF